MFDSSLLGTLVILGGVCAFICVALFIYRSLVGMKEEDRIFLGPAENKLQQEQQQIVARLNRLAPYTKGFGAATVVFLLAAGGIWLYHGLVGL